MDIPKGLNIWIPGTNLRNCIEEAIMMWLNECPNEVSGFAKDIRVKHDGLHKDNGMSKNGIWKEHLEIPFGLAARVRQMTNHAWMHDKQICAMIQQLIPDLMPYKGKDGSRVVMDKVII